MALSPGTRIGSYEITAQIGVGGMGEVYRATDTKLKRDVAIKVLPDALATDTERLARFQREAEVLASLNHPNIAAIHGLEDADGSKALVMELVEGPTLAEQIGQGAIPLAAALPIATQMADALQAAHNAGVVHRDLKPANVKVRPDGTVKVLDFGLAKAYEAAGGRDETISPTVTSPAQTLQGVIMGTAAYMSPEQASGAQVDQRSDIWAFGVVLYEMLTGRRLFEGNSVAQVLARVLERELSFTTLPAGTPSAIRRLLRRCLQREPGHRLHHIADARVELRDALSEEEAVGSSPPARRLSNVVAASGAVALLAVLAAVVAVGWSREEAGEGTAVRFTDDLPAGSQLAWDWEEHNLALSPDGTRLAYVSSTDGVLSLWLRSYDREEHRRLPGTEGASSPFWSPDGDRLAFFEGFQDRVLKVVRLDTGTVESLCRCPGDMGSWGRDGTIIFLKPAFPPDAADSPQATGLYRVQETGGEEPVPIEAPDDPSRPERRDLRWPRFLPDGRRVLFQARRAGEATRQRYLYVGDLADGTMQPLFPIASRFEVMGDYLVYVRDGVLLAKPFDFDTLRATGADVPLGSGVPLTPTGAAPFTVAPSGNIAYATEGLSVLVWRDRRGVSLGTVGDRAVYGRPRLSADGSLVVVSVDDGTSSDVWTVNVARGSRERVTSSPFQSDAPVFSPVGDHVVYLRHVGGPPALHVVPVGGGSAEEVFAGGGFPAPSDWTAAGNRLAFTMGGDIWLVRMDASAEPERRFATEAIDEADAAFSPDGRWLAYGSDSTGRNEIYIAPVEGAGAVTRVSLEGGESPRWRGDGGELFWLAPDGAIVAAPVSFVGDAIVPGTPTRLFSQDTPNRFDVWTEQDGSVRFLAVEPADSQRAPLHVVLHWNESE